MSKERELLKECRLMLDNPINGTAGRNLQIRITELLAQLEQDSIPEQDSITDATPMAYMPNGSTVSNVYEAYEEGRKSVMFEQEPVAWMYDWDDEHERTRINLLTTDKEHTHLKTAFNIQPLYTSLPAREPLSYEHLEALVDTHHGYPMTLGRAIEKAHGIGECNSHYKERHETFGEGDE